MHRRTDILVMRRELTLTNVYYLDTNICISYMRGKNAELRDKIDAIPPECIKISAIVKGELLVGA